MLHAQLACYEFQPEGRYAALKAMGIKHEITKYVESFYEKIALCLLVATL